MTHPISESAAQARKILNELPPISEFKPLTAALARAKELDDKTLIQAVGNFVSMPESTLIIANPVQHELPVECSGAEITLKIRSFAIRGILTEEEIIRQDVGAVDVIFVGLFGRRPTDEEAESFGRYLDEEFYGTVGIGTRPSGRAPISIDDVAAFVAAHPGVEPATSMQAAMAGRKADDLIADAQRGLDDERDSGSILEDLITTHLENVATGIATIEMNRAHRDHGTADAGALAAHVRKFFEARHDEGKSLFQAACDALVGRALEPAVSRILEIMGTIQTHHGSAGSNVVARYMASLHVNNCFDFFGASLMALDGNRHFGAIHDMSRLVAALEEIDEADRGDAIREALFTGGLPTFGHPEISAAGRGDVVQQDPRPAVYLRPLFEALDAGELELAESSLARLRIAQQIYRTALVEGVVKPGREQDEPLRVTPNTDFGAWCCQEALGIHEMDRTFLTYVFRGFGWMMDAREQLQMRIVRPVIPPDPKIIPKPSGDETITETVRAFHDRLATGVGFASTQTAAH